MRHSAHNPMTADEAIAIVNTKSAGRTRYEGQPDYLDEVLVDEIEQLRNRLEISEAVNKIKTEKLLELGVSLIEK